MICGLNYFDQFIKCDKKKSAYINQSNSDMFSLFYECILNCLIFTIRKTRPCNKQISFLALKIENFQLKKFEIFLIFAQNIGGSNEYPQSMFWSKNKKNRFTPAYPSFAI